MSPSKAAEASKAKQKEDAEFQEHARWKFPDYAIQYYVIARFAHAAKQTPVAGNCFHHAVELMLKHFLLKPGLLTLKKLAGRKYGHNLPRLWKKFKSKVADPSLDQFDNFMDELHRFDSIRYPDDLVLTGGGLALVQKRENRPKVIYDETPPVPAYYLALEDMDALMNALFDKCSVNPQACAPFRFRGVAGDHLLKDNPALQAKVKKT
jgi:hypothetical protein